MHIHSAQRRRTRGRLAISERSDPVSHCCTGAQLKECMRVKSTCFIHVTNPLSVTDRGLLCPLSRTTCKCVELNDLGQCQGLASGQSLGAPRESRHVSYLCELQ